jgi:hypothetical protein
MKSPVQGAATSIHLASAPELEQVTGRYFANRYAKKSSEPSYDQASAAQLWQVSADLVGVDCTLTDNPPDSPPSSLANRREPPKIQPRAPAGGEAASPS